VKDGSHQGVAGDSVAEPLIMLEGLRSSKIRQEPRCATGRIRGGGNVCLWHLADIDAQTEQCLL
jgi:hypothetical protein